MRSFLEALVGRPWTCNQTLRFFPQRPRQIYAAIERAGFNGSLYRDFWPDLLAALPGPEMSAPHFVEYLEAEVKTPRRFPIELNFAALTSLSELTILSRRWHASLIRNLIQAQIDWAPECVEDPEFWASALPIASRFGNPFVICGDSHTRVFRQTVSMGRKLCLPINLLCGGGSATGLANPTSRSGYGRRLETAMGALASVTPLVHFQVGFKFGQVDLEFVQTYRRIQEGETCPSSEAFRSFCDQVIKGYVPWLRGLPLDQIWVLGVNPPCISDNYVHAAYTVQTQVYVGGGIAETQTEDTAETLTPEILALQFPDKKTRTENHRLFNYKLRTAALGCGLSYMDNFDKYLGPNGCISPHFTCAVEGGSLQVGADGQDIHVGGPAALRVEADLIRALCF